MSSSVTVDRWAPRLDGAPVIAVPSGVDRASSNGKPGQNLIQTWAFLIIPDFHPDLG